MLIVIARENMALTLSAVAAAVFALMGISWGLWIGSLVILFDGAYSLVSVALSLLSLYAARVVRRPACPKYPFGRGAIEPLVIAVKGLVIALVCLLSLVSAGIAIAEGGRTVSADLAMVFAAVSVVVCLAVWLYLSWVSQQRRSGLLVAEARQWLMDTVLSAAVLVGFGVGAWLEQTAWSHLAVYADPVMMVLISGYFILVPIKMTAGAVRELLLAAPPASVAAEVHNVLQAEGIRPHQVKMAKVGPSLMLEIYLHNSRPGRISRLKDHLIRELAELPARPAIFIRNSLG